MNPHRASVRGAGGQFAAARSGADVILTAREQPCRTLARLDRPVRNPSRRELDENLARPWLRRGNRHDLQHFGAAKSG
jgi:hypothetical protein